MAEELMTRRECALENALRELLECVRLSDEYHCIHTGSKSQGLRAEADWVDRKDAAIRRGRELIGCDPNERTF